MPKTGHLDGSAKSDCHTSQVLFPQGEFQAARQLSLRLGFPSFSTFARAAVRIAMRDERRKTLVEEYESIVAEQRGETPPLYPTFKSNLDADTEVTP